MQSIISSRQYYIYYDNVKGNILAFATMFARIHTHNHLELIADDSGSIKDWTILSHGLRKVNADSRVAPLRLKTQ